MYDLQVSSGFPQLLPPWWVTPHIHVYLMDFFEAETLLEDRPWGLTLSFHRVGASACPAVPLPPTGVLGLLKSVFSLPFVTHWVLHLRNHPLIWGHGACLSSKNCIVLVCIVCIFGSLWVDVRPRFEAHVQVLLHVLPGCSATVLFLLCYLGVLCSCF